MGRNCTISTDAVSPFGDRCPGDKHRAMAKILVPTDFTDYSEVALARAVQLCTVRDGEIDLLHVDPPPGLPVAAPEPMYISPQLFERLRGEHEDRIRSRMAELKATYRKPVAIETHVRRDEAVAGIIRFATEEGTDLIVMGSHGAHATRYLLGSVAEKVSRQAPCPVLVARAAKDENGELVKASAFTRVLVAVDYSDVSRDCMRMAETMISSAGSLEVVHVWKAPYISAFDLTLGPVSEFAEIAEKGRSREAEVLDEFIASANISSKVGGHIAVGSPPMAILDRAQEIGADLIVVGAHSREGVAEHVIGTSADRILRHAQIPVLLVPTSPAAHGA